MRFNRLLGWSAVRKTPSILVAHRLALSELWRWRVSDNANMPKLYANPASHLPMTLHPACRARCANPDECRGEQLCWLALEQHEIAEPKPRRDQDKRCDDPRRQEPHG